MSTNISKFISLNDFILLEYEFNRDGSTLSLSDLNPIVATTQYGTKQYYDGTAGMGLTNNTLTFNSTPISEKRDKWYTTNATDNFGSLFDSSTAITNPSYAYDTVRLHVISGYNFDDLAGFLVQVRTTDTSSNFVDLSNFTYRKQVYDTSVVSEPTDVIKFSSNAIFLGNKFYDKYLQFKVPSVGALGQDASTSSMWQALRVKELSDVYMTFSTISSISLTGQYNLSDSVNVQLPVNSLADNFNCFIAEATEGDFIKFYATWNDQIIGQYMGDIESGRIPLYTSNNPNDNYEQFSAAYGTDAAKWVLQHEIYVWENVQSSQGTSIMTQKFSFTQDSNFSLPNYFRPVLKTADIDTSFTIQYTCRLMNRMDGTQIIRKASFSSMDPKKYGLKFTRLYVENLIPYKVFNRLESEKSNVQIVNSTNQTKYVQVFYDTTNVVMNNNNEIYVQGTGPLFLKNTDSTYKFKFERYNSAFTEKQNVDLSGVYNYTLLFVKDDGTRIELNPTYSTNMNTSLGEVEFKINAEQLNQLLLQKNNSFSIIVNNANGSSYALYQGKFYSYADVATVSANYVAQTNITALQSQVTTLQAEVKRLTDENASLKIK